MLPIKSENVTARYYTFGGVSKQADLHVLCASIQVSWPNFLNEIAAFRTSSLQLSHADPSPTLHPYTTGRLTSSLFGILRI